MKTPHLHVHGPSVSIKGGARQTSLDKLRLHGNTFESAFGKQSFVQAMQGLAVLSFGSDDSRLREYRS